MFNRKVEPHVYNGFQREGQPKGSYTEIARVPRYVVAPGVHVERNGGMNIWDVGLLFLSDKLGICHDSMMLADQYAAAGLFTVIPSYAGVATPPKNNPARADPKVTKTVHHTEAAAEKIIDDAIKFLVGGASDSIKRTRIVVVGYGCGVKHLLRLLAKPDTPRGCTFVAGFLGSPEGDPFHMAYDYSGLSMPLSLAFADDPRSSTTSDERERIRLDLRASACPHQINLYSHTRDSFAVRRAVASQAEVFAKRQAFVQSVQWFDFHLCEVR